MRELGCSPTRHAWGVTFVELIVSISLLCILGAIFFRVMGRVNQSAQPTLSDRLIINTDLTQASNSLIDRIRESLEVVRPTLGETTPFLVLRNTYNQMNLLFLEPDEPNSALCKKSLFRLKSFLRDGTPNGTSEVMFDSIRRLTFTCYSPNQVQFNLVLSNLKGDLGMVTQARMVSFGELE